MRVAAAQDAGKPVSICGDLVTEVRLLPFLLGIGLRTFSIDIGNAPSLERSIAEIRLDEAKEQARQLLDMGKISDIEAFLSAH